MAAPTKINHLSVEERKALGEEARVRTPPSSHGGWTPAPDRPDPVRLLEEQNLTDLNDFDETLPGPFEYDVKRPAASFTIGARNNGFGKADARRATLEAVRAYREAMAGFATMSTTDIRYARLDEEEFLQGVRTAAAEAQKTSKKAAKQAEQRAHKGTEKAHTRDSTQALDKLGEMVDGRYRIVSRHGQRRHPGLHRPAPRPRRARPAVPAGQGTVGGPDRDRRAGRRDPVGTRPNPRPG